MCSGLVWVRQSKNADVRARAQIAGAGSGECGRSLRPALGQAQASTAMATTPRAGMAFSLLAGTPTLWRRYLVYGSQFIAYLALDLLGLKDFNALRHGPAFPVA